MCQIEKLLISGFHLQHITYHTRKLTFVTLLRPFNHVSGLQFYRKEKSTQT